MQVEVYSFDGERGFSPQRAHAGMEKAVLREGIFLFSSNWGRPPAGRIARPHCSFQCYRQPIAVVNAKEGRQTLTFMVK
jgi:hypothetical protein